MVLKLNVNMTHWNHNDQSRKPYSYLHGNALLFHVTAKERPFLFLLRAGLNGPKRIDYKVCSTLQKTVFFLNYRCFCLFCASRFIVVLLYFNFVALYFSIFCQRFNSYYYISNSFTLASTKWLWLIIGMVTSAFSTCPSDPCCPTGVVDLLTPFL